MGATKSMWPCSNDEDLYELLGAAQAAAPTKPSYSVMIQLAPDPEFPLPLPLYSPGEVRGSMLVGLTDRGIAIEIAQRLAARLGRHTRVYVEGANYDTAEFGPAPELYEPRSLTATRALPGAPFVRKRRR